LRLDLGFTKGDVDEGFGIGRGDCRPPDCITADCGAAAKTEESRQLIHAGIHDVSDLTYSYVLPPGTPKDRVEIVRKAFAATMKDAEFIADARKSKLGVDPIIGDELEKTVGGLFKLAPGVVSKLKEVLK